jgi:hypothetical protein
MSLLADADAPAAIEVVPAATPSPAPAATPDQIFARAAALGPSPFAAANSAFAGEESCMLIDRLLA